MTGSVVYAVKRDMSTGVLNQINMNISVGGVGWRKTMGFKSRGSYGTGAKECSPKCKCLLCQRKRKEKKKKSKIS